MHKNLFLVCLFALTLNAQNTSEKESALHTCKPEISLYCCILKEEREDKLLKRDKEYKNSQAKSELNRKAHDDYVEMQRNLLSSQRDQKIQSRSDKAYQIYSSIMGHKNTL